MQLTNLSMTMDARCTLPTLLAGLSSGVDNALLESAQAAATFIAPRCNTSRRTCSSPFKRQPIISQIHSCMNANTKNTNWKSRGPSGAPICQFWPFGHANFSKNKKYLKIKNFLKDPSVTKSSSACMYTVHACTAVHCTGSFS